GYWGRPGLTAERFVPDPFSAEGGARLYRTGDLGRWLPEGVVEYLGRADGQVKVRGVRVELGEIEGLLCQHRAVRQAAVAVQQDHGETRLVAYVVPRQQDIVSIAELHEYLRGQLPAAVVPAAMALLEALPLT